MRQARAPLLLALIAVPLCALGAVAAAQVVRRDSAGVLLIEYASIRDARTAFTVESLPRIRFGGPQDDPAQELTATHPFPAVVGLSDGRWAVVDADHVNLYERDGKFAKSFGRRGAGPGEFQQILRLCRLSGDTLLAINYNDRRSSLWTADGRLIQGFAALPGLGMDPCFGDGTVIVGRAPVQPNESAPTQLLVRATPDGVVRSELGEVPAEDFFRPIPRLATVLARGDQVIVAENMTFEVRAIDLTGKLRRVLRIRGGRDPLNRERWNAGLSQLPPRFRARFEGQPPPEYMPAFGKIESDDQGRLWIRDQADWSLWTVFDNHWSLLGRVRLPKFNEKATELAGFAGEFVVLKYRDADDFTLLGLHRLAPSRP